MNFLVSVSCKKCNCDFELRSTYLAKKDTIVCPCCGAKLPDDMSDKLCKACALMSDVPEKIGSLNVLSENGFLDGIFDFPAFELKIKG